MRDLVDNVGKDKIEDTLKGREEFVRPLAKVLERALRYVEGMIEGGEKLGPPLRILEEMQCITDASDVLSLL